MKNRIPPLLTTLHSTIEQTIGSKPKGSRLSVLPLSSPLLLVVRPPPPLNWETSSVSTLFACLHTYNGQARRWRAFVCNECKMCLLLVTGYREQPSSTGAPLGRKPSGLSQEGAGQPFLFRYNAVGDYPSVAETSHANTGKLLLFHSLVDYVVCSRR